MIADEVRKVLPFEPMPWAEHAACAGMPAGVFFDESGAHAYNAKQVCAECPVREECLDYAIRTGTTHGIWGGLSPKDRRPGRRRIERVAMCGTDAGYYRHTRVTGTDPCDGCRWAHTERERERRTRRKDTA